MFLKKCEFCGKEKEYERESYGSKRKYCSSSCSVKAWKNEIRQSMPEKCIATGCNNKSITKGYCKKHYLQHLSGGVRRTCKDRNEINILNDHAEIVLRNILQEITGVALISVNKVDRVKPHKWSLNKNGYATAHVDGKKITLHRFLTDAPDGKVVDHINRKRLDCRDENLRITTQSVNARNSSRKPNKADSRCLFLNPKNNKWQIYLTVNYKRYYKGAIKTKEEALKILHDMKERLGALG